MAERSGSVVLFTGGDDEALRMWTVAPGGAATSRPVTGLSTGNLDQVAAAPDGSVYAARGTDGLWRIRPDGRAVAVIRTARGPGPDDGAGVADFHPFLVRGVAVADDGTVYVSDTSNELSSLRVHRLADGRVSRIAGAIDAPEGSHWSPETIDPARGVPALSPWIPGGASGYITWSKDGVIVQTHGCLVRITSLGRILPFVAARNPAALKRPSASFQPFGRAIDAAVVAPSRTMSLSPIADLAVDASDGALFYGAGSGAASGEAGRATGPAFDWPDDLTRSQRSFAHGVTDGQAIYRAEPGGSVAAVVRSSTAVAVTHGYVYVANESCSGKACPVRGVHSAVIRVRIP